MAGARVEGFHLRSTSLNFGVTVTGYLFPLVLVAYFTSMPVLTTEVLAITGALVVPLLIYRPSRSRGLMNFYIFFPEALPANGDADRQRRKT